MARSRIQLRKECFVCGALSGLHEHHIFFGTANRRKSEKYGMKVYLCRYHHEDSRGGIHFNKELDNRLKQYAQVIFEEKIGSRSFFIHEFGKSWLYEEGIREKQQIEIKRNVKDTSGFIPLDMEEQ